MTTSAVSTRAIGGITKRKGLVRGLLVPLWRYRLLYLMVLPSLLFYAAFRFYPLLGNIIAFKDYRLSKGIWGSPWVGLAHFRALFGDALFVRALRNTASIGSLKLLINFPAPIALALLLNEIRVLSYKRVIQTIIYVPHFLSWVIYAAVLYIILSPTTGLVNTFLAALGFEKIFFFQQPALFQPIVVISSILKESGWAAIIYLAAISAINPELYEAAAIDGGNRWQMMRHITLPGIAFTIVTLFILQIGYFLNVGFAQVFVLQNPMVYSTGDIIETFIYRVGISRARFDFTCAAGLFNSVVGMIMVLVTDRLARRMDLPGIF
jgi:putative aldouronate transport system permease protein